MNNQRKTFKNMNKANLEPLKQTFISFNKQQIEQSYHSSQYTLLLTILYAYSDHKLYPLVENIRKIK